MHYPWWHIPFLTSPMLIAIIATFHVFVSLYAVGGGIFLAIETSRAYRYNDRTMLDYLKNHTWFFILITVVYGAITGVGIWWVISLASPLATEELIHIFVFGWAMEYVTFLLEIVSAFIFYYYWGRLDAKTHTTIGWIYAASAWASLLIITAITAFQLNPGSYLEEGGFWTAMLNPQMIPQVLARTGASLMMASLYVFLHASFTFRGMSHLAKNLERRTARYAMIGAGLILVGGLFWYLFLPESAQAALVGAAALNILMILVAFLSAMVIVMMYFGPYKNPGWVSPGFALLFFLAGISATGTGEFVREAVRKPYVIYNVVFGHGIYPGEIPKMKREGFLENGTWTKQYVKAHYPQLIGGDGKINSLAMLSLEAKQQAEIGHVLFQYHCNDCHAVSGYSGVREMTRGWKPDMIRSLIDHLEISHIFMPPWSGTKEEAEMLTQFLLSIQEPRPGGMRYSDVRSIGVAPAKDRRY